VAADGTAHVLFTTHTERQGLMHRAGSDAAQVVYEGLARMPALALDAAGEPRAVFATDQTLRHAVRASDGTFHTTQLDAPPAGDARAFYLAGWHPRLAVDAAGESHVSYFTWTGTPDAYTLHYVT